MANTEPIISLYEDSAPGSEHWTHHEQEILSQEWQTRVVFNVAEPTLTLFRPEASNANRTAVIICPGGGYHALSIDSEGFDVAKRLIKVGVTCFVLKYRLVPCQTDNPAVEMNKKGAQMAADVAPIIPLARADGQAAIAYVRSHAEEYGINAARIGIMGFSAGGTVTGSVMYDYTEASKPNFAAPIYLQYEWVPKAGIPADAPPIFILAATDDPLGLAPHSIKLYNDWTAAGNSAELHLYATGGHGFGMRTQKLPSDRWIELLIDWMGVQGLLA